MVFKKEMGDKLVKKVKAKKANKKVDTDVESASDEVNWLFKFLSAQIIESFFWLKFVFKEPPKKRKKRPIREPSDHSEDEAEAEDEDDEECYPQNNTPVESEAEMSPADTDDSSDSDT